MRGSSQLSRRTFLKGAAALGALGAVGAGSAVLVEQPKALAEDAAEEFDIRYTFCQMCGPAKTACATKCYIKDGRWVHVEGNPEAGNNWGMGSRTLCAKGNSAMQVPYSPLRLLYPMKRVGEKGEGKFERCSYEEAVNIIAEKLTELKEQYGPESYAVLSPQSYPVLASIGQRFLSVHGSPNYLHSAICEAQRRFTCMITIGGKSFFNYNNTAPGQMDKTKLYIVWGKNTENSEINQGEPNRRVDGAARGMKIVDIRPLCDALGSKADIWLPVRPGTDCALALAFLNVIIGEDLYDHDFVENWCSGFDKLAEHVKQYTPEWASLITGIPVEQIYEVGRMMGTIKPMGITFGNGIGDQQSDGNWGLVCVCLIEAITGNIGIAGGAGAAKVMPPSLIKTGKMDLLNDRVEKTAEDEEKGYYPGMSKLVAPETPRWFQTPGTWVTGPTSAYYKAIMSVLTEEPYPLRALFGQSSNPLSATRQPKKIVEALKKIDFYFVMDTEWNSSCDFADVVIPALTHYEISDQFATKNRADGTWIGMNQKIIEPIGEGVSDWRFYCDLGVAMGYGADFWDGDFDQALREQLEPSGFTLEELREKGSVFVERTDGAVPQEPKYQNYEELFSTLPGGKVQCYNEYIGGKPNADETGVLDYLPVYRGPAESLTNTPELAEEYPLILSDVHAHRLSNHSYYHDIPYLRELQPYPWVKINPATAKKYGIEDGDWMKIESPHGWIKMTAMYFEGVAPDVLMTKRGWWQSCEELGLEGYGYLDGGSEVNVLYSTDEETFDDFHSAMGKQTLVKINKLEEGE